MGPRDLGEIRIGGQLLAIYNASRTGFLARFPRNSKTIGLFNDTRVCRFRDFLDGLEVYDSCKSSWGSGIDSKLFQSSSHINSSKLLVFQDIRID